MGATSVIHGTPDNGRYDQKSGVMSHPPVVIDWLAQYDGNTLRAYSNDMLAWLGWCGDTATDPIGATRAQCDAFRAWLTRDILEKTGAPRSGSTQARVLSSVASLYQYMESEEVIERSPLVHVRRPRATPQGTAAMTEDQARAFLTAAHTHGHKEYVAAATMLGTAVRASGLLSIRVERLRIEGDRLIAMVILKGGDVDQIPLPSDTADAVDSLRGERTSGPLFLSHGRTWSYDALHEAMVKVGQLAGVPFRTSPHVLRATWATIALSHDVSPEYVRAVMGHKKIETTMGYDRRRRDLDRKAKAVDVVAAVIRGAA